MAHQYPVFLKAGIVGLSVSFTLLSGCGQADSYDATENEHALATAIFGDKINTRGLTHHFTPRTLTNPVSGGPLPAEVPDEKNIHFYDSTFFSSDYGGQDTDAQSRSLYVHELTHIMQFQAGMENVLCKSGEKKTYRYTLKPEANFADYCVEQQASMVQDYADRFLFREQLAPYYMTGGTSPEKELILREVIEAAFPAARATRLQGGFVPPGPDRTGRAGFEDAPPFPGPALSPAEIFGL